MTEFYPALAFICLALGLLANLAFERLLDYKALSRRYLPPQRLVTSRYRQMAAAMTMYESIFAEMMDKAA